MNPVSLIAWALLLVLLYYLFRSKGKRIPIIFSHWHHFTAGLEESSQEFYGSVERAITSRNLTGVGLSRVEFHEGSAFSAKREYLRVVRQEHIFDICAAPYGNGFFISWWLGEEIGWFLRILSAIPFLGPWLVNIFKPQTYYRIDTATMFQESVHSAVTEVLDERTKGKGLKTLSEAERKPIMTDFFAKIK